MFKMRSRHISNFISLGAIQVANFVMPMISFPIISRIIGPEKFGVIQYSASFLVYFTLFINYGFNLTAIRKLSQNPNDNNLRSDVFNEVLTCQIILFFISSVILGILIYNVPLLSSDKPTAFYTFLFLISVVLTQNWMFQVMQDLKKVALLNIGGKLVFLVLILLFIREKKFYFLQPLLLSLTQILVSIISMVIVIRKYNIKVKLISIKKSLLILKNERLLFFSQFFSSMYLTVNIIVLGWLLTPLQIGYFTSSQKLITISVQFVSLPLTQILFPILSNKFSIDSNMGINYIQRLFPIIFYITLFFSLSIFIFSDFIVVSFFGDEFKPTSSLIKILSIVPLLNSMNNLLGIQLLTNLKLDRVYLRIMVIVFGISVIGNVFFSQRLNSLGAAINWVFTELLIFIMLITICHFLKFKIFNMNYFGAGFFINCKKIFIKKI